MYDDVVIFKLSFPPWLTHPARLWLQIPSASLAQFGNCITCTDKALSIMRRTEHTLCLSFILIFCCKFLPGIIFRRFWPVRQRIIFQDTAGGLQFRALCDQLDNLAIPRLWDSDVYTVPASLKHVTACNVIAECNHLLGLDALIRGTARQCLLLHVPVYHRQLFEHMLF